jgi:hypothetical protein
MIDTLSFFIGAWLILAALALSLEILDWRRSRAASKRHDPSSKAATS